MSSFNSMAVTVMRGEEFHTITLTDEHDVYTVERLANLAEEKGYEVVSVVVYGYNFTEEMWKHIGYIGNISVLFEALTNSADNADDICAFITVNDCADADNWGDRVMLFGTDYETVVREWVDMFHKVYKEVGRWHSEYILTDSLPSWLTIDWEDTLDTIALENNSVITEFNGYIYYFGE